MHDIAQHYWDIRIFLGSFYLGLALMNGVAAYVLWHNKHKLGPALFWLIVSGIYVGVLAPLAFSAQVSWMPRMPHVIIDVVNSVLGGPSGAVWYTLGSVVGFALFYIFRRFLVIWWVAWSALNLATLTLGLSLTDKNFHAIAAKPDNVPIVGLIFLLGFFTWLATAKAVENDDRAARGLPPKEKEDDEKILVWPDLVYTELICMVAVTALLLFWALALEAPLEEPASSVKTPNPSKAPWYFLGLQEMLVYFDPWMAGVVLPSMVVGGLMAIPYLDFNPKGNGYYTIAERQFSYITFQFGFLVLWITLIIMGTFLRGQNWNIFSPYELWDVHKSVAMNNIDLSQWFWHGIVGQGMPKAPSGSGFLTEIFYIVKREWLGIALVIGYLGLLPPLMAVTVFREFYAKMGFIRFMVMSNLLLVMMMLPIKMALRFTINLKYVIAIPEYFLNL